MGIFCIYTIHFFEYTMRIEVEKRHGRERRREGGIEGGKERKGVRKGRKGGRQGEKTGEKNGSTMTKGSRV